jgi:hypothetical protein
MDRNVDADRRAVHRTLQELSALLDKHEVRYGPVVRDIAARMAVGGATLSADDRHTLLGGMGSLNDVWISRRNGHKVDDERSANERLDQLRTRLFDQVSRL